MTVQSLLRNMSQKELVHWIAFYRLANEERERGANASPETEKPEPQKVKAKIVNKPVSQKQKDDLLLQQMFAIVQARKKKKGE